MIFWYRSGFGDPCLCLIIRIWILDPDPARFVIDLGSVLKTEKFLDINLFYSIFIEIRKITNETTSLNYDAK
jgi:hypothetical protein